MISYTYLVRHNVAESYVTDINALLAQLSPGRPPLTYHDVVRIASESNSFWLLAVDDGIVKGMGSMTLSSLATGLVCNIDDVVVDISARRKGIANGLVTWLINRAWSIKADRIRLTSNPDRATANRLYVRLGFKKIETNVYGMKFGSKPRP